MIVPPYQNGVGLAYVRGANNNIEVRREPSYTGEIHFRVNVSSDDDGPEPRRVFLNSKQDLIALRDAIDKALAVDAEYPEGTQPPELKYY